MVPPVQATLERAAGWAPPGHPQHFQEQSRASCLCPCDCHKVEKQSLLPACAGTDGRVEMPGVWVLYALGTEGDFPWREQVAAVVTTPLLPGMLEFQCLTPGVPGRASPARCCPDLAAGTVCIVLRS